MPGRIEVVVAVLTYRRTDHLAQLLPALVQQCAELAASGQHRASILVVDNDPAASARPVTDPHRPRVCYVHETEAGIAAGRARALREASGADALVFIDDDERPTPGWLHHLVLAWVQQDRPAGVVGRVSPTYAGEIDPWITAGGFFLRRRYRSGTPVGAASSANLLLDVALLQRLGLTFDRRLGLRGGEDTLLTRSLTRGGHQLLWCDEAEVIDLIPDERMERRWVLRRAFSHGVAASRVELALTTRPNVARLRLGAAGALRVLAGAGRVGLGKLRRRLVDQARGWRLIYRGAGLAVGAAGHDLAEYRRPPDAEPDLELRSG